MKLYPLPDIRQNPDTLSLGWREVQTLLADAIRLKYGREVEEISGIAVQLADRDIRVELRTYRA